MRWLLLLVITVGTRAGSIQGVVIEHASGRPLARVAVRLDALPKSTGQPSQPLLTRSGRSGHFVFPSVPSGLYLLTASREGYFRVAYGQRLPAGAGVAISVTPDSTLVTELRMRHKGALTGRVLDENGVGASGVPVVAYRAFLPLRISGTAISDDRGVFRISGLEPGKYWVRSGTHMLQDGTGWSPTFGLQSRDVRNAQVHQVKIDVDTAYADVSPESGPVFGVGGWITCEKPGSVLVTLSSDTGERSSRTLCGAAPGSYDFQGLSSGNYELVATAETESASAFAEFTLGGNLRLDLSLLSWPEVEIEIWHALSKVAVDIPVKLIGRPQTLASFGDMAEITGARTKLASGYWEFRALVPDGYYVDAITNMRSTTQRRGNPIRSATAFEVFIEPRRSSRIRVTVSDQAGKITGAVKADPNHAAGAPVFLWPVAEAARRSLGGPLQSVADVEGNFHFGNLPPGDYRLLASFDVNEIDEQFVQASNAPLVTCKARQSTAIDLVLWMAPY